MSQTETATRRVRYVALDRYVLAVAVKGVVNDWAAYIGAVAGTKHDLEAIEVSQKGTKLDYKIARMLFPDYDNRFAWRD